MPKSIADLLPITDLQKAIELSIAIFIAVHNLHSENKVVRTMSLKAFIPESPNIVEISTDDIETPKTKTAKARAIAKNREDLAVIIDALFNEFPSKNENVEAIKTAVNLMLALHQQKPNDPHFLKTSIHSLLDTYLTYHIDNDIPYNDFILNYALTKFELFIELAKIPDYAKSELRRLFNFIPTATGYYELGYFTAFCDQFDFYMTTYNFKDTPDIQKISTIFQQHLQMLIKATAKTSKKAAKPTTYEEKFAAKTFNRSRKLTTSTNDSGKLKSQLNEKHIAEIVKAIHAWKRMHPLQKKFIIEINASEEIKILDDKTDSDAADSRVFSVLEATDGKLYAMHQLLGEGGQGKVKMMQCLIPNIDGEYPLTPVKIMHMHKGTYIAPKNVVNTLKSALGELQRNDKQYSIMKFVPGHDMFEELYQVNKQAGENNTYIAQPLSIYKKLMMAIGATSEVMRLHDLKILHRDIKPKNFMFESKTNTTTIIDLDLAIKIPPETDGVYWPQQIGTPGFTAPEATDRHIEGVCVEHSFNSDGYALGVTIDSIFNAHTNDDRDNLDPKILADLNEIKNQLTKEIPEERLALKETLYRLYDIYLQMYRKGYLPATEDQNALHNIAIDTLIKQTLISFAIANDKSQYRRYRKFFTQASAILAQAQPITKANIEKFNYDIEKLITTLNTKYKFGIISRLLRRPNKNEEIQSILRNMLNEVGTSVVKLEATAKDNIDTLIKQTLISFAIANDKSQYRRYRKFFTQASAILAQAQPITKDNIEKFNNDIEKLITTLNTKYKFGIISRLLRRPNKNGEIQSILRNMLNEVGTIVVKLEAAAKDNMALLPPYDSPGSVIFKEEIVPSPRTTLEVKSTSSDKDEAAAKDNMTLLPSYDLQDSPMFKEMFPCPRTTLEVKSTSSDKDEAKRKPKA